MTAKNKTQVLARAWEIFEPTEEKCLAVASLLNANKAVATEGITLTPQMDLLYLRSCLVSVGTTAGINDNDDIFTREAAWAARHTPVLKPMNWQHQDKDILGVIYSVEARDLDGNVLAFDSETAPDCDYEFWTEAVLYRMIHKDRVSEVEARSKANDLFVSMEAWFDDYEYGLCNDKGHLARVVARNESTSFLDKFLKANSGAGSYRDPASGRDFRIGRVLASITFGGCGLVDRPANKRSVISDVATLVDDRGQPLDDIDVIVQALESQSSEKTIQEEALMNAQASNDKQLDVAQAAKDAVAEVLTERDAEAQAKAASEAIEARAAQAEQKSAELEQKNAELQAATEVKNTEISQLKEKINEFQEVTDTMVKSALTEARDSQDTPPEIAMIDSANQVEGDGAGDAEFRAKISWLQDSRAALAARAAVADELETQLAQAESIVREQEIRSLFEGKLSEETVEQFVSHASALSDDDYSVWRDEKELMILEMSAQAALPPALQKVIDKKKGKKTDEKDDAKANLFRALLEQRRLEAMEGYNQDDPSKMPALINQPTGPGINSGVPAGVLRTQRFKIAGSAAGNDLEIDLDLVQADDNVNFAGTSQAGSDGESGSNPFAALASEITGYGKEDGDKAGKPDFDPTK